MVDGETHSPSPPATAGTLPVSVPNMALGDTLLIRYITKGTSKSEEGQR